MLELSALTAASIEQGQVHRAALHCMDGFFGAVVPHEHHDLKETCTGVEPDAQLTLRHLVVQGT